MVVGVDVAGERRGFHVAVASAEAEMVEHLFPCSSASDLKVKLGALGVEPTLIAIDCPPRCQLCGPVTRAAERELHKKGFSVQWTRRQSKEPQEWMRNGQRMWEELQLSYPAAVLIEAFPTVATESLLGSRLHLPLHLLAAYRKQRDWKDFVDACICVDVGQRYLKGMASRVGDDDELGPIWF